MISLPNFYVLFLYVAFIDFPMDKLTLRYEWHEVLLKEQTCDVCRIGVGITL